MSERKDTIRSLQDQRKKLVEQRDEARAALEAERQSPTLRLLQADKDALGRQVDELKTELVDACNVGNALKAENLEQRQLIDEMIEKFKALKLETAQLRERYDAELAKLKVDDVALLKKRLAQKSEELRLMTEAKGRFAAAADKLKTERDQAHGVLALVPKPVIDEIRASLKKPQLNGRQS